MAVAAAKITMAGAAPAVPEQAVVAVAEMVDRLHAEHHKAFIERAAVVAVVVSGRLALHIAQAVPVAVVGVQTQTQPVRAIREVPQTPQHLTVYPLLREHRILLA